MAKKIPIDIDLNAREAQRSAKELNRELQATEDALEDVESAGKTMARVIQSQADDMISEIDATRRAVDALERSLGPDFTADPTSVVADLKRVGLTAQEIESDADELAAALKRIDDVKIHAKEAGFDELDQAVSGVERTSRTASVAIGGIGNSISELPGIGGTLGPVAESMGQLAEGALEGEANLKQLVVAGGGLAALGLTMGVISKAMASAAETKAFNAAQVEGFRDALREVEPGMSAVVESLRDAEGITGRAGGIGTFFEDAKDITSDLKEAGVTYDEWVRAIEDGGAAHELVTDKLRKHRDAVVDDRNEAQRNGDVTVDLERKISALDDAIEIAGETRNKYTKAVELNSAWEEWSATATDKATTATEDATDADARREEAVGRATEALEAQRNAQDAATNATLEALDSSLGYRNQVARTSDEIASAALIQMDANRTLAEQEQAARDAEGAVLAQAAAAVRLAEDQALANGETLTAEEKARVYKEELQKLADQLGGPMAAMIQGYIDQLNKIPKSITTNFNTSIGSTRNQATNQRVGVNARGTTNWRGGPTWVGEEGAELIDLPTGTEIIDSSRSRRIAEGATNGHTTINLNVTAGLGANGQQIGRQIVDILEAHYRNGGQPPRTRR